MLIAGVVILRAFLERRWRAFARMVMLWSEKSPEQVAAEAITRGPDASVPTPALLEGLRHLYVERGVRGEAFVEYRL